MIVWNGCTTLEVCPCQWFVPLVRRMWWLTSRRPTANRVTSLHAYAACSGELNNKITSIKPATLFLAISTISLSLSQADTLLSGLHLSLCGGREDPAPPDTSNSQVKREFSPSKSFLWTWARHKDTALVVSKLVGFREIGHLLAYTNRFRVKISCKQTHFLIRTQTE